MNQDIFLSTNEKKAGENDKDGASEAGNVPEGPYVDVEVNASEGNVDVEVNVSEGNVDVEVNVSEGNKGPTIGDSEEEKDSEPTEVEPLIESDQNV